MERRKWVADQNTFLYQTIHALKNTPLSRSPNEKRELRLKSLDKNFYTGSTYSLLVYKFATNCIFLE